MTIVRSSCFAILIVILASPVSAETGNEILKVCQSDTPIEQGFCYGTVGGVLSGLVIGRQFGIMSALCDEYGPTECERRQKEILAKSDAPNDLYCIPTNVNLDQLKDVFVKYLNDHPESRHLGTNTLVYMAMGEAFPCRK